MADPHEFRRLARESIRKAAREEFYSFYRLMFPVLAPDEKTFIESKHFQVMATALQKVVTGETPRLLNAIPPRHGKSLLASVALPAWIHGSDPTAKIICASYGDQLAKDFALRTREVLRSPAYHAIFPNIPRSRHNPKILGVDDAKIVGDRITEVRPIPGNLFTQETERRIGELGASCVAFVVRDMSCA